jgi:hypothetical protein
MLSLITGTSGIGLGTGSVITGIGCSGTSGIGSDTLLLLLNGDDIDEIDENIDVLLSAISAGSFKEGSW